MASDFLGDPIKACAEQIRVIRMQQERIEQLDQDRCALEAKLAEYREELVSSWAISFAAESVNKGDGWECPYMSDGEYAAAKLLDAGLVEKHPTEDWYRWKKKGGE